MNSDDSWASLTSFENLLFAFHWALDISRPTGDNAIRGYKGRHKDGLSSHTLVLISCELIESEKSTYSTLAGFQTIVDHKTTLRSPA